MILSISLIIYCIYYDFWFCSHYWISESISDMLTFLKNKILKPNVLLLWVIPTLPTRTKKAPTESLQIQDSLLFLDTYYLCPQKSKIYVQPRTGFICSGPPEPVQPLILTDVIVIPSPYTLHTLHSHIWFGPWIKDLIFYFYFPLSGWLVLVLYYYVNQHIINYFTAVLDFMINK
jgi:hypothetical protein